MLSLASVKEGGVIAGGASPEHRDKVSLAVLSGLPAEHFQ